MKEARIFSLILIPTIGQYVVSLEEVKGSRLIPIWIGINEGNAIVLQLQGEKTPRPMTHDLMANMLKEFGLKVEKVIITDLKDNTYFAEISVKNHSKIYTIDSRPSDAMALAVRTNSPIYVDDKVFAKCPIINKPITEDEVEKFKNDLKSLRPEDFFKKFEEEKGEEGKQA